jgi:predicted ATPase
MIPDPDLSWAAGFRTIALDGCDGTGKTTLAQRLREGYGFTIVHVDRTPDDVDLTRRYRQILAEPGPIVLDRCFLSELVYGPLFRHWSRITWEQCVALASEVMRRDGVLVHLTATANAIRSRLLARPAVPPTSSEIDQILSGYAQLFEQLGGHVLTLHIDTTP